MDFGLLFMCHFMWFGGISALFSQIALMLEYSFDVKWGAKDCGLLFMYPCTWFAVLGPSFPKLPQYLSACKTGIIWPTEGLHTSVRSHWMWNKKLKLSITFRVTLYILDLGLFEPFSPQIALTPKYRRQKKAGITESSWSWQKSKISFDVKCGAEDYQLL